MQGSCYVSPVTGHTVKGCPAMSSSVYCKQIRNRHTSLCSKQFQFKINNSNKSEFTLSNVSSPPLTNEIRISHNLASASSLLVNGKVF